MNRPQCVKARTFSTCIAYQHQSFRLLSIGTSYWLPINNPSPKTELKRPLRPTNQWTQKPNWLWQQDNTKHTHTETSLSLKKENSNYFYKNETFFLLKLPKSHTWLFALFSMRKRNEIIWLSPNKWNKSKFLNEMYKSKSGNFLPSKI